MTEKFSVCQFFPDGSYEYPRRNVEAKEAIEAAVHYATSVGARLGTTVRVIITDNEDCIAWEWTHADGIVFPEDDHKGKLKGGIRG